VDFWSLKHGAWSCFLDAREFPALLFQMWLDEDPHRWPYRLWGKWVSASTLRDLGKLPLMRGVKRIELDDVFACESGLRALCQSRHLHEEAELHLRCLGPGAGVHDDTLALLEARFGERLSVSHVPVG
jgi:hypothetical protein